MDGIARTTRSICVVLALTAATSGLGCSMWKHSLDDDRPRAELITSADGNGGNASQPLAKYYVELHPAKDQPKRVERSLTGPMTIQQALKETGALKEFRRSEIELVRTLPGGAVHRMTVEYDRGSKQVAPEFDYSLQPGDRIIVNEDTTTVVDDMLNKTLGPYNPMKGGAGAKGRTKSGGHYRVAD